MRRLLGVFVCLCAIAALGPGLASAQDGEASAARQDACAHLKTRICEVCPASACERAMSAESTAVECEWVGEFIENAIREASVGLALDGGDQVIDERDAAAQVCAELEQAMTDVAR